MNVHIWFVHKKTEGKITAAVAVEAEKGTLARSADTQTRHSSRPMKYTLEAFKYAKKVLLSRCCDDDDILHTLL